MKKVDISVLICTWNNSKRLSITLDSFTKCLIPPNTSWELILVNNNCTDDTDQVVEQYLNRLPIIYIHEPIQGLSQARNTALSVAKGELILFTDDDVKPDRGWISAYWEGFKKYPEDYFFGGPVVSDFESDLFDRDLMKYATQSVSGLDFGDNDKVIDKWYFIGPNWACSRSALAKAGGFNVKKGLNPTSGRVIVGEETDLMDRLRSNGLKALYLSKASLRHFVPTRKCTLKHVSSYQEGYYREISKSKMVDYHGPFIFGIPRWLYKAVVVNYFKWIMMKLLGKKAFREYIAYREILGSIKGALEYKKSEGK